MTSDFLAQASSTEKNRVENINVKTQQCTLYAFFYDWYDSGGLSFELCVGKRVTMHIVCYFNINYRPVNRAIVGNKCELKPAQFDITC
jgi:hypothetical protein